MTATDSDGPVDPRPPLADFLDDTAFDRAGYRRLEEGRWQHDRGAHLSVDRVAEIPDLPAGLDDLAGLRDTLTRFTADTTTGALIEADVVAVDGLPAVRQLVKLPLPGRPSGLFFVGAYTIPRATGSLIVRVRAAERGTTGFREALIMAKSGPDAFFRPHPYAPDLRGNLPFHVGDGAEWDAEFPDHPLTLVRAELARLGPAIRLGRAFRDQPPFTPGTAR
ncbi:hypothetical protein LO772_24040 [Yinghuangia sp. ASG 101]|uniref:hypothetical protein n=1 Tax=Yinghuangia sp. ASG 101 TaxID=2896848 RepID=UPI001E62A04C|nr:hypothetical protein [Yinghuangia sp. ASG 101]UGQ09948.1 hypothetical protein LO772_24040 [Yinghuangia sp. ASG 101]